MNRRKVADQSAGVVLSCDKLKDCLSGKVSLKDSLKTKILKSRNDKGLEQIRVDFTPKSLEPMTKAEKDKERRRKECNRRSANRSRMNAKKIKETNEKMLENEQSRKNELLYKEREMKQQKHILLKRLREFGVSENEISKTLFTITCENKTLQSANRDNEEDQRSVFYLTRSEESENYPETSNSFTTETSEDVYQNEICDSNLESVETLARNDNNTGYDVMDQDFGLNTPGISDTGYQILPVDEVDLSQMADGEVLTVIISYEDPKVATSDEPIYTNL